MTYLHIWHKNYKNYFFITEVQYGNNFYSNELFLFKNI